ncbi:hypothetical protein CBR_g50221 [Chara braunii]|uniref:HAT C-terminal dimerisation domain-containing protein n=1 Tax=Chara braunii TaxID=69332 RepID=A0A388M6B2_CHABU|nr:hypothetical protein CBR_g50221 [Chara braunii]|eukprot:GBG90128.1 hypothetical protein CBR_g50221 [Chara braunii]
MVQKLMNAPTGFRYAKYDKARTTRVEKTKTRIRARVEELRKEWVTTGYMLQLDGWTDRRARPHINVMVSLCSCRENGGLEFGHIFSVPCTAHSIDLVLEQFAKIGWVDNVLKKATEVAKFFTNHGKVRDLLTIYSKGIVVAKPGATQFATNFIMLDSVQELYLSLRACITDPDWKPNIVNQSQRHLFENATDLVLDDKFWAGVEKVQSTSKELLLLLKFVDGEGPTISKVYAPMDSDVEKLRAKECFSQQEKDELEEIIMRRWNTMTSPLHCATMFLDPEYRRSKLEKDAEVMDGFWTWVYLWCKPDMYRDMDEEVDRWIDGLGRFNSEEARAAARGEKPARRWRKWCSEIPNLQRQAIRLLGQGSSSSACERNWSLFERIHSRPRNKLSPAQLNKLVFNRWNQHLSDKITGKKPDRGNIAWEDSEAELTPTELSKEAEQRVKEWRERLRRLREREVESSSDDEDDDDEEKENGQGGGRAAEGHISRLRHQSELLEMERELNETWRKATRPSKWMARSYLGEVQRAAKTMTVEHADKYISARQGVRSCPPNSEAWQRETTKGPTGRGGGCTDTRFRLR